MLFRSTSGRKKPVPDRLELWSCFSPRPSNLSTPRLHPLHSYITMLSTLISQRLIHCQLESLSSTRSSSHWPSEPLISKGCRIISPSLSLSESTYFLLIHRLLSSISRFTCLPSGWCFAPLCGSPPQVFKIRSLHSNATILDTGKFDFNVVRLLLSVAEKVSFVGLESSSGNGEGEGGGER